MIYFTDNNLKVRDMVEADAQIIFDTYLSYKWHPDLNTYLNYYAETKEGKRKVFIAEYDDFNRHNRGIGNRLLDVAVCELPQR